MQNQETAWAEISLSRLSQNVKRIGEQIGGNKKIGAVVKADAYGLGAVEVAKALNQEPSIQMLIVGKLWEACEIASAAGGLPVLILDPIGIAQIREVERSLPMEASHFIYSAYDEAFLQQMDALGKEMGRELLVHIRTDISYNGMGIAPEKITEKLFLFSHARVTGIYTHLYASYCSDWEGSQRELCRFDQVVAGIPKDIRKKLTVHAQNSVLLFTHPDHDYTMVRSGTAIYGLPCVPGKDFGLKPVLSVKSRICDIVRVKGDARLSYKPGKGGKAGMAARCLLGYWDCPFLMTQERIMVWINGNLFPLWDEPCMDHSCIAVQEQDSLKKGDEVVFLGDKRGVTVTELLERHGIELVHSERLYLISKRLPKYYIKEDEV